ncbi:MAG TPA: hypothetical protein VKB18_07935 [Gemmatimonadota bacterium]|nr:hypothetical protein [Gemmatimonadota bacterium]
MARKEFPSFILAGILGALTFAFLHLHFVTAWQELYVQSAWPGFEQAARRGLIQPWFTNSPRSLRVTEIVLFGLSFVVGLVRGNRPWGMATAVWVGVMTPLIPVLIARSFLSGSKILTITVFSHGDIPTLALLYEAVRTGVPIFAGMAAATILLWLWNAATG